MKILFASRNPDKHREIKDKVSSLDVQIMSPDDFPGLPEIEEDGDTLEANAVKKALAFSKLSEYPALADDTGLEVDALGGGPGVFSARYAGPDATYRDNVEKLLREMQGIPEERRRARFRCVLAYAQGGDVKLFEGIVDGVIAAEPAGESGFGYDPVFFVPGEDKTFAQMPLERKNSISHRGRALDAWVHYLRSQE